MNQVPCEVIRDLLPSYIDGLTSETTNRLIEEHLKECEACREVLRAMRGPEDVQKNAPELTPEEQQEIDFLKKNKKKNRMIVLFSVLGAFLLILLVLLVRVFLVGNKNYTTWAPMHLEVHGKELSFNAVPTDSASAIAGLSYTEEDGVVTMRARSVLVSPFYRGSKQGTYTAKEEIREVRIGDRIVWSDGATVSAQAAELFATRHLYIGDMPANQKTANALNIGAFLGPFTNELETAKEPYGWKIILSDEIAISSLKQKEQDMDAFARVLIGLIDNLEHVTYKYSVGGQDRERTMHMADASNFFGEDIKNCGKDVRALDRLMEMSGLQLYAQPVAAELNEDEVWVQLMNQTEDELPGIGISYYKDGELCSSGGMVNADGSMIAIGESLSIDMTALEFGGTWNADSVLEVEIRIESEDGTIAKVPGRIRITPVVGSVHQFRLTGSAADGYRLEQ